MLVDKLIDELSKHHPKGFDLSLDRIRALLAKLENPQHGIPPALHVAGTNGKGSTIAFLRAILESAGKSVHVHTSPHLVSWHERYRLGGTLVTDEDLANAIERVAVANNGQPITIFELLSAVMFVLFSEHDAEFSLVEVGLGGRLDATNVIEDPVVSIITPIALDHQAYLGDTIEAIAGEKAGIIKPKKPVIIGDLPEEARDVLLDVAQRNSAPVKVARQDFDWYVENNRFVYQDENGLLDLPLPKLLGEHQLANAALAIAAIRTTLPTCPEAAFANAMETVVWPGRMHRLPAGEITNQLSGHSNIWVDGGHNPAAGAVIADVLRQMNDRAPQRTLMIAGMINTKDPHGYFEAFSELDVEVITVPVSMSEAGIDPEDLSKTASSAGLKAASANTLENALEYAKKQISDHPDIRVLFCGSLYMVGEVLEKNNTPPV